MLTMAGGSQGSYMRGVALSASGMLVISPDGLLLRMIGEAGPWETVFHRSLLSGIILAIVWVVRRTSGAAGKPFRIDRYTLISALLVAVANTLFVGAIVHTTVANTLIILAAMPLFGAILGWLLIGEKVRPRTWISILLAICGVVVIFADSLGGGTSTGNALALVTSVFLALNLIVLRRAGDVDIVLALSLAGFLAAAIAWPFADPFDVNGRDMAILAVLGLVVLPGGSVLFFWGTRYIPAVEVALLALLETVLGPIWVWLGIGEVPTVQCLIGGLVVLLAVGGNAVLALRPRRMHTKPAE